MGHGKDKPGANVDFDADLHGEIETDFTGKNILIRDPDASIDTSELEILDYSPPTADPEQLAEAQEPPEENQYDPYNSGSFYMRDSELVKAQEELAKAREWKTKSRK